MRLRFMTLATCLGLGLAAGSAHATTIAVSTFDIGADEWRRGELFGAGGSNAAT